VEVDVGPSRLQATAATWLDLSHGAGAARRLAEALAEASAAVRLGGGGTRTAAAAGARRAPVPAAGTAGLGSLAQFRDRRRVLQRLRDEARGEGLNPAAAAAAAARHAGRHDSRRGPDAPTPSGAPPATTTATTATAAAAAAGDGGGTAVVVRLAVVDLCLHLGHATATAHALLRKGM